MKTRNTVPLSRRLDAELDSYVAAAKANTSASRSLAAAVAIGAIGLGLTPALNAEVVYTPANQVLDLDCRTGSSRLYLDLNHDGIVDFNLRVAFGTDSGTYRSSALGFVQAYGNGKSNQVMATAKLAYQSALPPGALVGPGQRFGIGFSWMADFGDLFSTSRHSTWSLGPWRNVTNRYLGLRFLIDGETHYGWARLNVIPGCISYLVTLTGYAYETEPNKPIRALGGVYNVPPQESNAAPRKPETLGVLALGAAGRTAPDQVASK
jgi:hypothetical protein